VHVHGLPLPNGFTPMYTLQRLAAMARCVEKRRSISCASIGRLSAIDAVSCADGERRADPSTLLRIAGNGPRAFGLPQRCAYCRMQPSQRRSARARCQPLSLSLSLCRTGGRPDALVAYRSGEREASEGAAPESEGGDRFSPQEGSDLALVLSRPHPRSLTASSAGSSNSRSGKFSLFLR
jgi:hypothetical protein